jgi:hypothetical protein
MRPLLKRFLWLGLLAFGLQTAWAFSMLGPDATYSPPPQGDLWQVVDIGYSPPNANVPPFIDDTAGFGPKNQGEGYRLNSPVMYYAFDPSFSDYFGSNGEYAVQQAFDTLNYAFTNNPTGTNNGIDGYSAYLSEFPLNSESENYTAASLQLQDVKSFTLSLLLEQLGLTDAIRYTWALHDRQTIPGCQGTCPDCYGYIVVMRNFDYYLTPLGYDAPDWGQYSPYVNGALYGYKVLENCGIPNVPDADAYEIPANSAIINPPVASGHGEGYLPLGFFYTGLTRDDAAGLRWLYSATNYDTPSPGYLESPTTNGLFFSTNVNVPQLLYTSNLNVLAFTALTNDPATLQTLYPTLQFGLVTNYFSNVVSQVVTNYYTNYIGAPAGTPATLVIVTNTVTNIVEFYQYAFGNVITNQPWYSNTTYALQTVRVGPPLGAPAGSPYVGTTNYQWYQSNVVSGDFFIVSNGACAPNIIQILQTNLNTVTNLITSNSSPDGQMFMQNLISYSTNHVFVVQPCTLVTNAIGDYQGIEKIHFVRVQDDTYDYQSGQFYQQYWITNQYTMVVVTNSQLMTRTFQRVLTTPDFLFAAKDMENGPAGPGWVHVGQYARNVIFNQSFEEPANGTTLGTAGPGTIDPPSTITYNKVGADYVNVQRSFLNGPTGASFWFIWGSFDGTTNMPVVYPNGASLANLAAEAVIQISPPPPTLPNGTNNVPYSFVYTNSTGIVFTNTFSATGGTPPYTWSLNTNSAALPGLSLSSSGVISGTPTNSGTYYNIVIQMTDSSYPTNVVDTIYSLTIN